MGHAAANTQSFKTAVMMLACLLTSKGHVQCKIKAQERRRNLHNDCIQCNKWLKSLKTNGSSEGDYKLIAVEQRYLGQFCSFMSADNLGVVYFKPSFCPYCNSQNALKKTDLHPPEGLCVTGHMHKPLPTRTPACVSLASGRRRFQAICVCLPAT